MVVVNSAKHSKSKIYPFSIQSQLHDFVFDFSCPFTVQTSGDICQHTARSDITFSGLSSSPKD